MCLTGSGALGLGLASDMTLGVGFTVGFGVGFDFAVATLVDLVGVVFFVTVADELVAEMLITCPSFRLVGLMLGFIAISLATVVLLSLAMP